MMIVEFTGEPLPVVRRILAACPLPVGLDLAPDPSPALSTASSVLTASATIGRVAERGQLEGSPALAAEGRAFMRLLRASLEECARGPRAARRRVLLAELAAAAHALLAAAERAFPEGHEA